MPDSTENWSAQLCPDCGGLLTLRFPPDQDDIAVFLCEDGCGEMHLGTLENNQFVEAPFLKERSKSSAQTRATSCTQSGLSVNSTEAG